MSKYFFVNFLDIHLTHMKAIRINRNV